MIVNKRNLIINISEKKNITIKQNILLGEKYGRTSVNIFLLIDDS